MGSAGATLADGATVLFDAVVNDAAPAITYSAVTGAFTITVPGNYYVHWWVDIDGTEGPAFGAFSVLLNGAGGVIGALPLVTGEVVGDAVITVGAVPATISLVNSTGATVAFAAAPPVRANLSIVETVS